MKRKYETERRRILYRELFYSEENREILIADRK